MTIRIDGTNTAANPGITGTDTDTGLQFGTDEVNVVTGGSTRATVDSSGRLLVGTTSNITSDAVQIKTTDGSSLALTRDSASSTSANGLIRFRSNEGDTAFIVGRNGGTQSPGNSPGQLEFFTTPSSSTSPTERMRLTSDGYMNLGTNTTFYHTIKPADGNTSFQFTANAGQQAYGAISRFLFSSSNSGAAITDRVDIQGQGLFRVFTTAEQCARFSTSLTGSTSTYLIDGRHSATGLGGGTSAFIIYSNGNIANANNSYTGYSDVKLKENIVDATSQWDDIKAIKVRKYNFKEETGYPTHTQLGVVAQELEVVSPGLVIESPEREPTQIPVLDENGDAVLDENGDPTFNTEDRETGEVTKSVNYSVLYMKAVKALQEAMERIEQLETRVAQLEGGTN